MRLHYLLSAAILIVVPQVQAQRFVDVPVAGADYTFMSVAPSQGAGLTAFSFENKGKVRHELVLVRLRPGVTPDSVVRVAQTGTPPFGLIEAVSGVLIAEAGQTADGRLLVDLLSGRIYMLVCNFRDAPDKPPHIALGMVASFQVK